MADLAQSIQNIADWITLHLTVWILIGTGLYLTVRSRFMQIRQFPEMIRSISGSRGGAKGWDFLLPGIHDFLGRARGRR